MKPICKEIGIEFYSSHPGTIAGNGSFPFHVARVFGNTYVFVSILRHRIPNVAIATIVAELSGIKMAATMGER